MPANIMNVNGVDLGAFGGTEPWHKLGQSLPGDVATVDEVFRVLPELDFDVKLEPMILQSGAKSSRLHAIVASGDGWANVLGTATKRYTPHLPRQAAGVIQDLVGQSRATIHTAGALGDGECVWFLCKLPDEIVINPKEIYRKYLLFTVYNDGRRGTRVRMVYTRVVCGNTVAVALNEQVDHEVKIYHRSGDILASRDAIANTFGIITESQKEAEAALRLLYSSKAGSAQVGQYFRELYPTPEGSKRDRAGAIRGSLIDYYENGRGMEGAIRGTWAQALNAVTEYVDHNAIDNGDRMKLTGKRVATSARSALWGTGADIKKRAFGLALEMATV